MKQFFKFLLASLVGTMLALLLAFFIGLGIIGAIVSSSENEEVDVKPNSILHLKLDKAINDRANDNPFESFNPGSFSVETSLGLNSILKCIKNAKEDDNIKGILLDLSSTECGIATIEEIREALLDFKKNSKKFIYSYSEGYSQGAYLLASTADSIFLYPEGTLDFHGLKAEIMFYKGALEKLDVQPEVIRHGKFKSAVEPFLLEKMSPENRKQIATYVGSLWRRYLEMISETRKISTTELQGIADELRIRNAKDAVNYKMVDAIIYKDQLLQKLNVKVGKDNDKKPNFISLKTYAKVKGKIDAGKDKIAVIYAEGGIESGKSKSDVLGSETVSEALRKARLDDKVKAVVLRVNSPGGSALASDVIWREVVLTRALKPIVVSMGDVAASGGYYIACAANKIVAQQSTITGSIGVFGLMFNGQKLLNNKLGITVDTFKTARFADIGTMYRPLTAPERAILQQGVEEVYDSFIGKVASGRKISKASVDSIGQGRVWSGVDAKGLGLVDEFGGLNKAISIAAGLAKVDKYRVTELPEEKEPLEKILESLKDDAEVYFLNDELAQVRKHYQDFNFMLRRQGIQAYMPYHIYIY